MRALLLGLLTAIALPAFSQGLCLGPGCAKTVTPPPPPPGGAIKWHPGYYGSTANYTRPGNPAAGNKLTEINMVRAAPTAVLGILESYYWRVFENQTQGSYDFSVLDTDYKNITGYTGGAGAKTSYSAPRRLIINLYLADYFNADPSQAAVPQYILDSATYGAVGPDGSDHGYSVSSGIGGGACGSAGSQCGAIAAIYRASVMGRAIALMQALAAHTLPDGYTVDASPYVEAVIPILETATTVSLAGDSTWSDGATMTQLGLLEAAMTAAFPHTNLAIPSNYMGTDQNAANVVQALPPTRNGESGPDVFGFSSGQGKGSGLTALTPGQLGYIGGMGGKDLRGVIPEIANVQNTELIGEYGHYYKPCDILQQGVQTLEATHMTWQIVTGEPSSGHAAQDVTANWSGTGGVLAAIVASATCSGAPLKIRTACPTSYASGCNTN
jgi:hypothetical protein